MLLASSIGFLALVGPAQIFYAIYYDPEREMQSNDAYKSFIIRCNIYQCFINTYYAASFVFCFASSSIFRREIEKLLSKTSRKKHSITNAPSETFSTYESRPFLHQTRLSSAFYSNHSPQHEVSGLERKDQKRGTESAIETDS